jgi:diguanylate cyclase (GGDEF)-like protein/PAS domain S-box-containing protein
VNAPAGLSPDTLPCAALATDGEGRLLAVNAAFEAAFSAATGHPDGGWPGRRLDELLPPAGRIFLQTHVWPTLLRTGRIDEIHLPWRNAQGGPVAMLMNAALTQPAARPDQQRVTWALFPARERQRFEAELLLARQRLENLVQSTDAGTWEWNVQTGEVRVNSRWAQILGWTVAELGPLTNQFRVDIAHPDELEHTRQLLREHFAGRSESYIAEVRLKRRSGEWIWLQDRGRVVTRTADGKPEWMFGIHIDIGRMKQQEAELRRAQSLLERSNEMAGVGGWELDLRTQALYWSDQTCRIHGVPPGYRPRLEEALDFYPPEARPRVEAAVQAGMASGTGWDLELPFVRRDGTRLMVHALGRVEHEHGQPARLVGAFQDISARVEQQAREQALAAALAREHELLRVTLHSIGDAVITTDREGRVTWLNPVAERLTGWPEAQAQGRPLGEVFRIVHEHTRQPAPDPVQACLDSDRVATLAEHTLLLARDGREIGIEDSAAPIRGADGLLHGAVLVFHDVTEQRRLVGEVRHRAAHDALTGLPNRAEFESRLRACLERAQRDGAHHVLLFVDLDQFKLVNDACGHAAGDELLRQVARLLQQTVRGSDTLARLGGDEFAVILEHCTGEQALRVATLVCERVDGYRYVHGERRFRVGTSIGLVPVDARWSDTDALMKAADVACYAAKEAGRNRVHVWHDGDEAVRVHQGQMQWATRLEQAIDEGRFVLHAQRIVCTDAAQHTITGAPAAGWHGEVLVRLREADGNLVMPGAFLPAAERFKLAARVDGWVLRRTLALLAAAPADRAPGQLGVNLSGQSIGDAAFRSLALSALQQAGRAACQRLCLEITETTAIANLAEASAFIGQLHEHGVKVALDDFGAGSASFGYLKQLPVDLLKIDGQFVRNLLHDALDEAAVRAFVDVARVLKLQTVAEFVDEPALLPRLRELGVQWAQGYLLHRPEPLESMLGLAVAD